MSIYDSCGGDVATKVQMADDLWGGRVKRTATPFMPPEEAPQIDKPL